MGSKAGTAVPTTTLVWHPLQPDHTAYTKAGMAVGNNMVTEFPCSNNNRQETSHTSHVQGNMWHGL